jgi:hypothetical protein
VRFKALPAYSDRTIVSKPAPPSIRLASCAGDANVPGAHVVEELLLRRWRARAQKLLHRPRAVDREAQRSIRAHLFQQPVEVAILQLLDFRLVIGKTRYRDGCAAPRKW